MEEGLQGIMKCPSDDIIQVGSIIYLSFAEDAVHIFDQQSEQRLFI